MKKAYKVYAYTRRKEVGVMSSISNDWLEPLSPEFKKEYYRKLYERVKTEYATQVVFPPSDEIFSALQKNSTINTISFFSKLE